MSNQQQDSVEAPIRRPGEKDFADILAVINAGAQIYRGKIPHDCWHEPYMSDQKLRQELAAGVIFFGIDVRSELVAVMGVQHILNVQLIRHAYVIPDQQGQGLGRRLIEHICGNLSGQILVGTWRAAQWAIGFYEHRGFSMVETSCTAPLLRAYWNIPERQLRTSVVLAKPRLDRTGTRKLIRSALSE